MADDQITYEGVTFQRVPDVDATNTPEADASEWWGQPTTAFVYRQNNDAPRLPVISPPYSNFSNMEWQGPASDQEENVHLEMRWPASMTAALERILIVVDMTSVQEAFETEPVVVDSDNQYLVRGYGYDMTGNGITGNGWNWFMPFGLDGAAFPGRALWNIYEYDYLFAYMAHDHYPGPVMIQPLDFGPQLHDPADQGAYMQVDGYVFWPGGAVRPTVDLYLPVAIGPPPPPPPGTVAVGGSSVGARQKA